MPIPADQFNEMRTFFREVLKKLDNMEKLLSKESPYSKEATLSNRNKYSPHYTDPITDRDIWGL